jgi:hypothetical protein
MTFPKPRKFRSPFQGHDGRTRQNGQGPRHNALPHNERSTQNPGRFFTTCFYGGRIDMQGFGMTKSGRVAIPQPWRVKYYAMVGQFQAADDRRSFSFILTMSGRRKRNEQKNKS